MAQHFRLSNEFVARGGSEKQTPSASQYNTIGHFSLNSPEHVLNETFLRPYISSDHLRSFQIFPKCLLTGSNHVNSYQITPEKSRAEPEAF